MKLREIEIVADCTAESRCDEGFLRVARLQLRNVYDDGSQSAVYPCDVVSRPGSDAVVAVVYEIVTSGVRVLLRDAPRAPVYLRRHKRFVLPDPRIYVSISELVAGLIEPADGAGEEGLGRRAAIEVEEEAGLVLAPEAFRTLGGETFASPGTSDEKLFYCTAPARLDALSDARGDGTVMEEYARLVVLDLREAIAACRRGDVPDMKTEVGLLRLADHLGYLPQLDCFAHELPSPLRERYRAPGIAQRPRRGEAEADG